MTDDPEKPEKPADPPAPAAPAPVPAKPAPAAAKPAAAKPAAGAGGGEAAHVPKAAPATGPAEPPPGAGVAVPAFITSLPTSVAGGVTAHTHNLGHWANNAPANPIPDLCRPPKTRAQSRVP